MRSPGAGRVGSLPRAGVPLAAASPLLPEWHQKPQSVATWQHKGALRTEASWGQDPVPTWRPPLELAVTWWLLPKGERSNLGVFSPSAGPRGHPGLVLMQLMPRFVHPQALLGPAAPRCASVTVWAGKTWAPTGAVRGCCTCPSWPAGSWPGPGPGSRRWPGAVPGRCGR